VRPEREHRRVRLIGAVLLALLALWMSIAVARGLILSAERSRLNHVSWIAVGITCLLVFVFARAARTLWRSYHAGRSRDAI
jgi:hypothetical protein